MLNVLRQAPLFIKVLPFYIIIGILLCIPFYQRAWAESAILTRVTNMDRQLDARSRSERLIRTPTEVIIPSQFIDMIVDDGNFSAIADGWNVPAGAARYASDRSLIDTGGSTVVIYARSTQEAFIRLTHVKVNEPIYLRGGDSGVFRYRTTQVTVVVPSDLHDLADHTGTPRLLLVTSRGILHNERSIVMAELEAAA